jgi:methanogenic corrinoid protein MtbC1
VATPSMDFAETSPRLVELTLLAEGWRVVMVGCGLPLSEIGDIVAQRRPRLVCLSVTHLEADAVEFAAELNSIIDAAPSAHDERCQYAVGGTAISASLREQLRCGLVASSLHELVNYQQLLRAN